MKMHSGTILIKAASGHLDIQSGTAGFLAAGVGIFDASAIGWFIKAGSGHVNVLCGTGHVDVQCGWGFVTSPVGGSGVVMAPVCGGGHINAPTCGSGVVNAAA
jgi:hypothetical protein